MESYIGNLPAGVLGLKPATNVIAEIEADGTQAYYDILLPDSVDIDDYCLEVLVNADGASSPVGGLGILHGSDLTRSSYSTNYMLFSATGTPVGGEDNDTYLCRFSDGALQMGVTNVMCQDGAFRWESHGGEYDSASTNYDQFWYFGRGNGSSLTPSNFIRIITLGTFIDAGVHIKVFDKKATNLILPLEYSAPRQNILMNSDFNINQRGYVDGTSLVNNQKGYDRWAAWGSNMTQSVSDGVMTIDNTVAGTDGNIMQAIEIGTLITGRQYTLTWKGTARASMWYANGGTYDWSETGSLTFTADAGSGNINDWVIFSGDGVTFSEPKLEEGSTGTPWEKPDVSLEHLRCKRFYQLRSYQSYRPIDNATFRNGGGGTTMGSGRVTLPVEMRATPNISYSAALAGSTWVRNSTEVTTAGAAPVATGINEREFDWSAAQAGVNGSGYWVFVTSGFSMYLDADL